MMRLLEEETIGALSVESGQRWRAAQGAAEWEFAGPSTFIDGAAEAVRQAMEAARGLAKLRSARLRESSPSSARFLRAKHIGAWPSGANNQTQRSGAEPSGAQPSGAQYRSAQLGRAHSIGAQPCRG